MKAVKRLARQKKPQAPPKGAPAWTATFSDLMNLLLCFFVLLFALSSVDEEKFDQVAVSMSNSFSIFKGGQSSIGEGRLIGMGVSQLNDLDVYFSSMGKTSEEIDEAIKDFEEQLQEVNEKATSEMYDKISETSGKYNLDDYVELSIDEEGSRYVSIDINGSLLYDSGKADLKEDAIPIFSKVGDILKLYEGYRISIIGHTDNVPISSANFASNKELSSARAIKAAEYLIDKKGIDPTTIEWIGRGEYDPIADNNTLEGKAKNRRIEIRIYNSFNSD